MAAESSLSVLLQSCGVAESDFWAAVRCPDVRLELTTIVFSHYNDKARWMLEACGHAFKEKSYLSFHHMLPVFCLQRRFSQRKRRDNTGSPLSTPALAVYDGKGKPLALLQDSTLIGRFAVARALHQGRTCTLLNPTAAAAGAAANGDGKLTEDAQVAELEKRFHDRVGTAARVVAYGNLITTPSTMAALSWNNAPFVMAVLHILMLPFIMVALTLVFKITKSGYARALHRLETEFDFIDGMLAANRAASGNTSRQPFLCGDKPTVADVTFAALAAPVLGIGHKEGYRAWMPPVASLPKDGQEMIARLRERPAGQLALHMYRMHRSGPMNVSPDA